MIRYSTPVLDALSVTDGSVQSYSPVWSGTGLAYTGTPATGFYVKLGKLVLVQIDVEFDNVSNFCTGQYCPDLFGLPPGRGGLPWRGYKDEGSVFRSLKFLRVVLDKFLLARQKVR